MRREQVLRWGAALLAVTISLAWLASDAQAGGRRWCCWDSCGGWYGCGGYYGCGGHVSNWGGCGCFVDNCYGGAYTTGYGNYDMGTWSGSGSTPPSAPAGTPAPTFAPQQQGGAPMPPAAPGGGHPTPAPPAPAQK